MSVHSVTESWQGCDSDEGDGRRDISRKLTVIATRPVSGDVLNEIRVFSGVPRPGAVHPRVSGYYCQSANITSGEGPTIFHVVAKYSPKPVADNTSPLTQGPKARWTKYTWQETIDHDLDGYPIASSAGEPFDPPLTVSRSCPLLSFTKNYALSTVSPAWLGSWADTVNSDVLTIGGDTVAIGEALIVEQPEAEYIDSIDGVAAYARVTFQVALKLGAGAGAWQFSPLDQGYREINGSGSLVTILDEAGMALNQPHLLDGAGAKLPDASPPVFLEYRTRRVVAMTGLGLVAPS